MVSDTLYADFFFLTKRSFRQQPELSILENCFMKTVTSQVSLIRRNPDYIKYIFFLANGLLAVYFLYHVTQIIVYS